MNRYAALKQSLYNSMALVRGLDISQESKQKIFDCLLDIYNLFKEEINNETSS